MANERNDKLTPERAEKALAILRQGRSVSLAARTAGVTRNTLLNWRKRSKTFAAAYDEAEAEGTDVIEDVLLTTGVQGNVQALLATLRARRRDKWGDKQEISGPGGGPVPLAVRFEVVAARPDGDAT